MIPHYYQSSDDTCGATCMRMVLESLGIKRSERELTKIMDIKNVGFAGNGQFTRIAESFRLSYIVQRHAKVQDVVRLQKEGYRIIVNFIDPEENIGHFAVVKSIDKKSIHLLDPWHGPHQKLSLAVFKKNWKSMFEPDVGLLIGIRK